MRSSDIVLHPHMFPAASNDFVRHKRFDVAQIEPFAAMTVGGEHLMQLVLDIPAAWAIGPKVLAVRI